MIRLRTKVKKILTTSNIMGESLAARDPNLHDALAAHALLRAIEEWDTTFWTKLDLEEINPAAWIRERASVIHQEMMSGR